MNVLETGKLFLGYIEDKLVYIATLAKLKEREFLVYNVCVDTNFRRMGICTKLMESILEDYRKCNIRLTVYKTNESAIKCYKKIGFVIDGETDDGKKFTMVLKLK